MTSSSNLQEISISSTTGDIILRFAEDVQASDIAKISNILSISSKQRSSLVRTAVLLNSPPPKSSETYLIPTGQYFIYHLYNLPGNSIGILPIEKTDRDVSLAWRGLLLFALFFAVLRGGQICFLHGTVLKHKDNTVTILFGESGVGKSTTARRYVECGGEVICDDQMLLHLHPDQSLTVSALPTWSRIKPSSPETNESYDVLTEYNIRNFCRLTRDPLREHLEIDNQKIFQVRLLKELMMHTYGMINFLPEEDRVCFGPHFMKFMDAIIAQFTPHVLLANIDAILTDSIPLE